MENLNMEVSNSNSMVEEVMEEASVKTIASHNIKEVMEEDLENMESQNIIEP
jgi:hypothetical protein